MRRWPFLLICLEGCLGFHDGGQSGSEDDITDVAACTPASSDSLSPNALPGEVDFAAFELIEPSQGPWEGSLLDVTTGDVLQGASMNLTYAGDQVLFTTFLASGFTAEGNFVAGVEDDSLCPPQYEIPMSLQLSLEDGSLSESLSVTVSASSSEFASFSVQVPSDQLVGALAPATFTEADFSSVNLVVTMFFQTDAWQGDISWFASREAPAPKGTVVETQSESVGIMQLTRP
jgi:hypothetical protein